MQISNHRTLTMSYKERERLNVLYRLDKGELRCADAAESLGISERQLYRLRGRYRKDGDEGLIHGLRGCLSNRGYGVSVRTRALELYRERYSDYGPTLFAEMIGKEHSGDLPSVDHETLRRWLLKASVWTAERTGKLIAVNGNDENRSALLCSSMAVITIGSRGVALGVASW